jgi:hypothetical protein
MDDGDFEQWLLDQIADDARVVGEAHASPEMMTGVPLPSATPSVAAHIARFADPSRVLSEIDTKRLTVREHYMWPNSESDTPEAEGWECGICKQPYPCQTLRLLAAPYWDRSGYREGWKP